LPPRSLYSRLDARHDEAVQRVEAALLRALLVTAVRQRRPDKVRARAPGGRWRADDARRALSLPG
jgi:hypothetical protein